MSSLAAFALGAAFALADRLFAPIRRHSATAGRRTAEAMLGRKR